MVKMNGRVAGISVIDQDNDYPILLAMRHDHPTADISLITNPSVLSSEGIRPSVKQLSSSYSRLFEIAENLVRTSRTISSTSPFTNVKLNQNETLSSNISDALDSTTESTLLSDRSRRSSGYNSAHRRRGSRKSVLKDPKQLKQSSAAVSNVASSSVTVGFTPRQLRRTLHIDKAPPQRQAAVILSESLDTTRVSWAPRLEVKYLPKS
jgi:hypothetical protein